MSREQLLRAGFSASRDLRRVATGLIILRATDKNPEWQRLPGSSLRSVSFAQLGICTHYFTKKSLGDTGDEFRLTAQSMKV